MDGNNAINKLLSCMLHLHSILVHMHTNADIHGIRLYPSSHQVVVCLWTSNTHAERERERNSQNTISFIHLSVSLSLFRSSQLTAQHVAVLQWKNATNLLPNLNFNMNLMKSSIQRFLYFILFILMRFILFIKATQSFWMGSRLYRLQYSVHEGLAICY